MGLYFYITGHIPCSAGAFTPCFVTDTIIMISTKLGQL